MNESTFNKTVQAPQIQAKNCFSKRHLSLNEGARRQEAKRIQHENHKILLQMNSLRPTPELAVRKLKKEFKKSESLKKQIVLTKYLARNEIAVKDALKKR